MNGNTLYTGQAYVRQICVLFLLCEGILCYLTVIVSREQKCEY